MNEPESYAPEGGWMGVTLRQTEIDLEDTAARMRRYETALQVIVDGPPHGRYPGFEESIAYQALNPD